MDKLQYSDLHAHIAELERQGLLFRVKRPINKDTEMHALVRWQFRGGIPEDQRKGFLFENVVDSKGRKFDMPVAVGILASNEKIYSVGIGCSVDGIKQKWNHAEQHQVAPVLVENPRCQEVVVQGAALSQPGRGVDGLPIPISTPGFDNAPYASCSMFISKDPDTGLQNIGNYRAMVKSPTRLGMNPEVELNQGIHEHWLKYKARGEKMPVALLLGRRPRSPSRRSTAAQASRRACGGGRARRRADPGVQGQDRRPDRAGGGGDRDRGLSRHRVARARGQLRRVARLHESERVQRVHGRDRDHAAQGCGAGLDHQPGDTERIEPDQARRLRAGVPASSAPSPQHQRRHAR
jgi:hypothetical protein